MDRLIAMIKVWVMLNDVYPNICIVYINIPDNGNWIIYY